MVAGAVVLGGFVAVAALSEWVARSRVQRCCWCLRAARCGAGGACCGRRAPARRRRRRRGRAVPGLPVLLLLMVGGQLRWSSTTATRSLRTDGHLAHAALVRRQLRASAAVRSSRRERLQYGRRHLASRDGGRAGVRDRTTTDCQLISGLSAMGRDAAVDRLRVLGCRGAKRWDVSALVCGWPSLGVTGGCRGF